jgi:DNA-binding CsgD family transcriptional regulator
MGFTLRIIKNKVSIGVSRKEIAEEYSISPKYIYQIINGKRRSVK